MHLCTSACLAAVTLAVEAEGEIVDVVEILVKDSVDDPFVYDELTHAAADLLRENRFLPVNLRLFAAEVLVGTRQRPTRPGPPVDAMRRFRILAWGLVIKEVAREFDVAHYGGGNMKVKTASDIVAEALRREGEDATSEAITKAYKELRRKERSKGILTGRYRPRILRVASSSTPGAAR